MVTKKDDNLTTCFNFNFAAGYYIQGEEGMFFIYCSFFFGRRPIKWRTNLLNTPNTIRLNNPDSQIRAKERWLDRVAFSDISYHWQLSSSVKPFGNFPNTLPIRMPIRIPSICSACPETECFSLYRVPLCGNLFAVLFAI